MLNVHIWVNVHLCLKTRGKGDTDGHRSNALFGACSLHFLFPTLTLEHLRTVWLHWQFHTISWLLVFVVLATAGPVAPAETTRKSSTVQTPAHTTSHDGVKLSDIISVKAVDPKTVHAKDSRGNEVIEEPPTFQDELKGYCVRRRCSYISYWCGYSICRRYSCRYSYYYC